MKLVTGPDGKISVAPAGKSLPVIPYDGSRRLDDWIASFLDYTDIVDVPVHFLRWAAISTLAGAAQRKIYMNMGHFEVYSNLYVILVGPPGTKKSTAIRAGMRLLDKVPGINLAPDAPSIPGLMEEFKDIINVQKDHQSLNAFVLELSSLYENAKETMTDFLTKMYDCDAPYRKRTRVGGHEEIPFPWLNLIAGTTPGYIGRTIGQTELEEGLEARKICVFSDEQKRESSRPKFTPRHAKLRENLIHDLARISSLYQEFDFEGGEDGMAFQWYDSWYQDTRRWTYQGVEHDVKGFEQAARIEAALMDRDLKLNPPESRIPKIADYRTIGYFHRKHIHLIKVAMIVSLSRKDAPLISLHDLMTANAHLAVIEADMPRVYSSVGGNEFVTDMERMHQSIKQAGTEGVLYSDLLEIYIRAMERRHIDDNLKALEMMGDIRGAIDQTVRPIEKRYFAA